MNKPLATPITENIDANPAKPAVSVLDREIAILAARFAQLLRQRFADDNSPVAVSLMFLDYRYREACGDKPLSQWTGDCVSRLTEDLNSPMSRLIVNLNLQVHEVELLLIAGLAEEHEGYADIFRTLQPGQVWEL